MTRRLDDNMKPTEDPPLPRLTHADSGTTPNQERRPTTEELFANACNAAERLASAREQMVKVKTSAAAIAYCYAFSDLKAARAALPKPRLVTSA
jgi:hypothetical protein